MVVFSDFMLIFAMSSEILSGLFCGTELGKKSDKILGFFLLSRK